MGKLRQGRRRRGHMAPEQHPRPPPTINHGLPPQRLLRTPSCLPLHPGVLPWRWVPQVGEGRTRERGVNGERGGHWQTPGKGGLQGLGVLLHVWGARGHEGSAFARGLLLR